MSDAWQALPEDCTLRACGPEGIAALAERWSETTHPPGAVILSAEDDTTDVFFVLSGRVRAVTYSASGREVGFAELVPGDCFGEIAAIDGGPRSASVVASTEARLARISAAQFNAVLDAAPGVMRAFLLVLARRLRRLSVRMIDVTTMSARQRLVAELIALGRKVEGQPDRAVIDPLPTQQALADAILGQREAVGREMSRLRAAGLVSRTGRRLTILSVSALRAELEQP